MNVEPSDDTAPAQDLEILTPSADPLNPPPRSLWITGEGTLALTVPSGDLAPLSVAAGWVIPLRATHVLPATTATVVALY
ncbi:hypothetical protein [Poseidonocella sp. HB161398]|uniref:spike base protein, RCAP_Rcc01079 family n=1 Tax=Poseidonocella sp. HB161398 TaxID=2320855 RepID=UPI00110837D2|nr:hypothetical protein [Poseidonocella sp. HB161398]